MLKDALFRVEAAFGIDENDKHKDFQAHAADGNNIIRVVYERRRSPFILWHVATCPSLLLSFARRQILHPALPVLGDKRVSKGGDDLRRSRRREEESGVLQRPPRGLSRIFGERAWCPGLLSRRAQFEPSRARVVRLHSGWLQYPLMLFFFYFFFGRNAINHRVISHPIERPAVAGWPDCSSDGAFAR